MRNIDEDTVTQAVIASHAQAPDTRLRDVMTALVQHLHGFAREVRLTEDEWAAGIRFLTEAGHMCSDRRQELAIIIVDVIGINEIRETGRDRLRWNRLVRRGDMFSLPMFGDVAPLDHSILIDENRFTSRMPGPFVGIRLSTDGNPFFAVSFWRFGPE